MLKLVSDNSPTWIENIFRRLSYEKPLHLPNLSLFKPEILHVDQWCFLIRGELVSLRSVWLFLQHSFYSNRQFCAGWNGSHHDSLPTPSWNILHPTPHALDEFLVSNSPTVHKNRPRPKKTNMTMAKTTIWVDVSGERGGYILPNLFLREILLG